MSLWDISLIVLAFVIMLLVVLFPDKLGFNCWRARRLRRRITGKGKGPEDYGFKL